MGHSLGNNYGKMYSFQSKPVWLDLQFTVNSTDTAGLGVTAVRGQGVSNVFLHTSATPGKGPNGYLNPNPAVGIGMVQLAYNYSRAYALNTRILSPLTGSNLAINASALTIGQPYQITAVGAGTAGSATIAPVADVSGSLASTWFSLYDAYGNTFIIWFSVSGVGSAPIGVSGTLVQQTISSGATAAQIGTALATTIAGLPSGISGVFSFTATGTTTVTVTSTKAIPIAGPPADGLIATGFTFAIVNSTPNLTDWQKVGVPKGIVPAVGVGFVATATGYSTGGGSSGTVSAIGVSGITNIETMASENLGLSPIPMGGSPNVGGFFLFQFLAPTSSSVTTLIPTAPANTSTVKMTVLLEGATRVGGNLE